PDAIHDAFASFAVAPKPAVLEIPMDTLSDRVDVEIGLPAEPPRQSANESDVARAVEKLRKARRPVIWVGQEVFMSGAVRQLRRLAEALDCPVLSGDGGKGIVPDDHPLSLGSGLAGQTFGHNPAHDYLDTCDLVLVVGNKLPHRATLEFGLRL